MGISDLEATARQTRDNQRRAELIAQLRELEGDNEEEHSKPTEYEKSMRTITEKLHNPQTMHDRQMHTNIPYQILSNLLMMDGIEEGLRELIKCDDLVVKDDNVLLYRKINPLDKGKMTKTNRFLYKTMKYSAYRRAIFYANAMQGFSGNLLELLMSVKGWRSEQGVAEVGALANTEQQKIGATNEEGWIRRQIKKMI